MTDADRPFSPVDRRALIAVGLQFFVNGAVFATFVPRLPEIRDQVGISVAGIGLLMSTAGVIGLAGSAAVAPAITRFGTRRVMLTAGVIVALSLPVIGFAQTWYVLLAGLIGLLMFDIPVDVSMNMQGSWLSARRHAPVMNRLHGLWSLGTLVGGVSAARIAAANITLSTHLLVGSAVLLGVLAFISRGLLRVDEHPATTEDNDEGTTRVPGRRRRTPTLLLFGLAGFFAVATEGTSIDWAAFRIADDFDSPPGFAALGYVAVALGMTTGRFAGDWMAQRLGSRRLPYFSITLAGAGLVAASLTPNRYVSLGGFVVAGVGIATMLPLLYDDAAKHPGRPGAGLGALTAGLRTAGLITPLVVGGLAATSLSVGSAIALVTLPSLAGFLAVTIALQWGQGRAAGPGAPANVAVSGGQPKAADQSETRG